MNELTKNIVSICITILPEIILAIIMFAKLRKQKAEATTAEEKETIDSIIDNCFNTAITTIKDAAIRFNLKATTKEIGKKLTAKVKNYVKGK